MKPHKSTAGTNPALKSSHPQKPGPCGKQCHPATLNGAADAENKQDAAPIGADILTPEAWTGLAGALHLSERQLEIIRAIFSNYKDPTIADGLGISCHTVHRHMNRLFKKLHATTRVQVVVRVMAELFALILSEYGKLPPLCRCRANGHCPLGRA